MGRKKPGVHEDAAANTILKEGWHMGVLGHVICDVIWVINRPSYEKKLLKLDTHTRVRVRKSTVDTSKKI